MPTPVTSKLPIPKSWEEFEDITQDTAKRVWGVPIIHRNGRQGQKQNGVDIYGEPRYMSYKPVGIQCKNKETLTLAEIKEEAKKAEGFTPELKEFIIATTAKRDTTLQEKVRTLSQDYVAKGMFKIDIWFWDDICLELTAHEDLLIKHFRGWVQKNTSFERVMEILANSHPEEWVYDDDKGIYTFKPDVNLTIRHERGRSYAYNEPWVKKFPDPNAYGEFFEALYNNNLVKSFLFVGVDGYRGYVPPPSPNRDFSVLEKAASKAEWEKIRLELWSNLTISPFEYNLGKIINLGASHPLDWYLKRAKITVGNPTKLPLEDK